ncbi:MAG: GTP-binding protein [Algicola sp.]|nr:GTP-binding protein [Algicola sp.]
MSDFKTFLDTFPRVNVEIFKEKHRNQVVENAQGQITHLQIRDKAKIDFVEIGQLSALQWLHLSKSQLTQLPPEIAELKSLEILNIENNQLTHLPPELTRLKKLSFFWINDNPIAAHLKEMTNSLNGIDLVRYLIKVQGVQTRPLNEAKLLVVGDERVGKTSLINRLQGKPLNKNETSTQGITIVQHQFEQSDIKVNIWDFAGQEITHQTHQFFLSARCVYLLVLDAQKEDDDAAITHWLRVIKANGDNPPVIVAVNKRDQNGSYKFDVHRYDDQHNIVGVLYLSAEDPAKIAPAMAKYIPDTIDNLASSIVREIEKLPDVRLPMHKNWLAVKAELEQMKHDSKDFIEQNQYADLCHRLDVKNNDDQAMLLKIFNQIGTIVTFENAHLCSRQIINPEWVTEGVYKVLRKPGLEHGGNAQARNIDAILTEDQFKLLFADNPRYQQPYHYGWLIRLLNQFQLSFDLDDDRVLIPLRLDPVQPKLDWSHYHKGLNFRFEYHELLKKSTIARFIVRLHQSVSTDITTPYWQRGVFLTQGNAGALVVSDEEAKTITIGIDKNNRDGGELLSIIRHTIRSINGTTAKASEQVPLLYQGQLMGFANYKTLLEAEDDGDNDIRLNIKHETKESHKFVLAELLQSYRINETPHFDVNLLTKNLVAIAQLELETAHSLKDFNEDQLNDQFRKSLTINGYKVADQSRGGRSESGKSLGERDLVIRNRDTGVVESILEGMILSSCKKEAIEKHYHKLNYRYDTSGNKRNFLLVYAKSTNFNQLWQKYSKQIGQMSDVSEDFSDKSKLKVGRSIAGLTEVYHIFIDFHS